MIRAFAGKSITFEDAFQRAIHDRPRSDFIKKDYRKIIKELDQDGEIDIPERSSPSDGLKENHELIFPENKE